MPEQNFRQLPQSADPQEVAEVTVFNSQYEQQNKIKMEVAVGTEVADEIKALKTTVQAILDRINKVK